MTAGIGHSAVSWKIIAEAIQVGYIYKYSGVKFTPGS